MQKGSALELCVEKLMFEGKALARSPEGKAVFLEGALPGERVRATLVKDKREYGIARLLEVIDPSPDRVAPRCRHFTRCGGCSLQYAAYLAQLGFKQRFVADAFRCIGKMAEFPLLPIVPSPREFGYRNKMEFSFSREEDELCLGLHPRGSFRHVVDLAECPIFSFPMEDLFASAKRWANQRNLTVWDVKGHQGALRNFLIRTSHLGNPLFDLVSGEPLSMEAIESWISLLPPGDALLTINRAWGDTHRVDEQQVLRGRGFLEETLMGLAFRISARSFFQTNPWATELLYGEVVAAAKECSANVILDLYCGTGTIACLLAREGAEVWGVERDPDSVRDAKRNAELNGLVAQFRQGEVEKMPADLPSFDLIVLDPPRTGLHPKATEWLLKEHPQFLIYISCNPDTLARDLLLLEPYELVRARPFDLFPQTFHVETMAFLRRQ